MREITCIFIHCVDSPNGKPVTAREVDRWHAERINKRELSGRDEEHVKVFNSQYPYAAYHELILLSGEAVSLRGEDEPGSHASGHNQYSVAVCLVGTDKFTIAQWESLKWIVEDYMKRYGPLRVRGHYEVNNVKSCPGFNISDWLAGGMEPLKGHIYE